MGGSVSSNAKGGKKPSRTNFETANRDPLSFIPEEDRNRLRSYHVTMVHVVAHTVVQGGGNHWDIFLQTGEVESVRLEVVPGNPGREGNLARLEIMRHAYASTHHGQKTISITATPGYTVGNFLDTIVRADNHRYEFARGGGGSSGWVRDQFYLFVRAGLIPPGWESVIEQAINAAWYKNKSQGPWPVTYGTYLRERSGNRPQGRNNRGARSRR